MKNINDMTNLEEGTLIADGVKQLIIYDFNQPFGCRDEMHDAAMEFLYDKGYDMELQNISDIAVNIMGMAFNAISIPSDQPLSMMEMIDGKVNR